MFARRVCRKNSKRASAKHIIQHWQLLMPLTSKQTFHHHSIKLVQSMMMSCFENVDDFLVLQYTFIVCTEIYLIGCISDSLTESSAQGFLTHSSTEIFLSDSFPNRPSRKQFHNWGVVSGMQDFPSRGKYTCLELLAQQQSPAPCNIWMMKQESHMHLNSGHEFFEGL